MEKIGPQFRGFHLRDFNIGGIAFEYKKLYEEITA